MVTIKIRVVVDQLIRRYGLSWKVPNFRDVDALRSRGGSDLLNWLVSIVANR